MVGRRFAALSFFGFAVLCTDVSALAQGASKEKRHRRPIRRRAPENCRRKPTFEMR